MPSLWFCYGKTPRKEGPQKREILLRVQSLPDVSWNPQYRMRQSFVVLQPFPQARGWTMLSGFESVGPL